MGEVIRMPGMDKNEQEATIAVEIPEDIRDILASIKDVSEQEYEQLIEEFHASLDMRFRQHACFRLGKYMLGTYHGWFENAAAEGLVQAQYLVARLIETGLIDEDVWEGKAPEGEPDWLAAAYWFDQADRQGYSEATGRALPLFQKVMQQAEVGNIVAAFDIGACYETGVFSFLPQNIETALIWYRRTAEMGSIPAKRALGEIHILGAYGIRPNIATALPFLQEWFAIADDSEEFNRLLRTNSKEGMWESGQVFLGEQPSLYRLEFFESDDKSARKALVDWAVAYIDSSSEFSFIELLIQACALSERGDGLDTIKPLLTKCIFANESVTEVLGSSDPDDYIGFALSASGVSVSVPWREPMGSFSGRTASRAGTRRYRKMEAALRSLAQQGVLEAALILGQILIEEGEVSSPDRSEGKAWLETGIQKQDLLCCLWYAAYARHGYIEANQEAVKDALRRVVYANHDDETALKDKLRFRQRGYDEGKAIFNEDFFRELQQRARVELETIEKEEVARQARLDAQKEMLSFLSHTLTNSVAGTTETLLRIAHSMGKAHTNPRLPTPAERLIGLVANFSLTERLVESFKLYASDPDALRRTWDSEDAGELPLSRVVALAIRQALVRFLFHTEHAVDVGRLLPDADEKAFSREFIDRALAFDLDRDDEVAALLDWVAEKLPFLAIERRSIDTLHCARNGARYVVVFSLVSELLGNALKYTSGSGTITLTLFATDAGFEIMCSNPCDAASTTAIRGGRKGMSFMRTICELVGARLEVPDGSETEYRVRAVLPIQ